MSCGLGIMNASTLEKYGCFLEKGKKDHKLVLEDVNMLVNHCGFALLYVNCGPLFFSAFGIHCMIP